MTDELNQVLRARREKLETLREKGVEPFAYGYDVTASCADTDRVYREMEESGSLDSEGYGEVVRIAGRVMSWRSHGKSAFADVEDGSGRVQIYLKKNTVGEESFELLDLLDLGDWIGVEGKVGRTRMGQITVFATGWTLLSKSLRPLPIGKVEVDEESGERPAAGFPGASAAAPVAGARTGRLRARGGRPPSRGCRAGHGVDSRPGRHVLPVRPAQLAAAAQAEPRRRLRSHDD